MRALTVTPGTRDSLRLADIAEPPESDGPVLVDGLEVGLCGTDAEIVDAEYGEPPEGSDFLVLGHENLGRVRSAPAGSGLAAGDLVVGIVRRPDPVPCEACAAGEWDMCRNGRYVEHGIKGLHGFARERSEESDPRTGRQLGNIPQAFSHFALVVSAFQLAAPRPRRSHQILHTPA